MTVSQIIDEIMQLSPSDQAEVIHFAYQLDAKRQLSGDGLAALAQRMVDTSNPAGALLLREAIMSGFYAHVLN
jgi:hypothetical protein